MRYAFIGDTHGNIEATLAVVQAVDKTGVDQVVHLGDVVGYGANPNECVELMRERGIPTVMGNQDAVACAEKDPYGFREDAFAASMWTRGTLTDDNRKWIQELQDSIAFNGNGPGILAVHGAPGDKYKYLYEPSDVAEYDIELEMGNHSICVSGHTHKPVVFGKSNGQYLAEEGASLILNGHGRYYVNPGSVGQPRDGDPRASFGVLDTSTGGYSLHRVAYDVYSAAHKITEARLPEFLATRLFFGM